MPGVGVVTQPDKGSALGTQELSNSSCEGSLSSVATETAFQVNLLELSDQVGSLFLLSMKD